MLDGKFQWIGVGTQVGIRCPLWIEFEFRLQEEKGKPLRTVPRTELRPSSQLDTFTGGAGFCWVVFIAPVSSASCLLCAGERKLQIYPGPCSAPLGQPQEGQVAATWVNIQEQQEICSEATVLS